MSYTALYRKYRPDTFSEVTGQEPVTVTLLNQVRSGRVGHAYLFCGTRGTGKTTVAKILAKAVNCESPKDGEPCNECASCRAIAAGASLNVIEIDAASNRGVDNIRRIREEAAYPPTEGRYKVYIIDEAHALTNDASNALLKTLEEPPSYVIFILATTEAHKVLVTVMSRCQRFDFRRISQEEITARLAELFRRENIEAESDALRYIARRADGGMRDALSMADQCISFYLGEKLRHEDVLKLLGAVDSEELADLMKGVAAGDINRVFSLLEELIWKGRDLLQLASDLTGYLRDLLLILTCDEPRPLIDASDETYAQMRDEAALFTADTLLRYIRILSDLSQQMRSSVNRRILFEVTLIRMCRPQMQPDILSLTDRVRMLEKKLEEGFVPSYTPEAPREAPSVPAPEPVYDAVAGEDMQRISDEWSDTVRGVRSRISRTVLEKASLKFDPDGDEDTVYVVSDHPWLGEAVRSGEALTISKELEDLIEDRMGRRFHVLLKETDKDDGGGRLSSIRSREKALEKLGIAVDTVPDDF